MFQILSKKEEAISMLRGAVNINSILVEKYINKCKFDLCQQSATKDKKGVCKE